MVNKKNNLNKSGDFTQSDALSLSKWREGAKLFGSKVGR